MRPKDLTPITPEQRAAMIRYVQQCQRKKGRVRHQHGYVKLTGKLEKKWQGHFYIYKPTENGSERRAHISVTLGLKSRMTKGQAEAELRKIIEGATAQEMPAESHSVRWFWENRFRPMREPSWKESSKRELVANVERYVLARFGDVPLAEVDRFSVFYPSNT